MGETIARTGEEGGIVGDGEGEEEGKWRKSKYKRINKEERALVRLMEEMDNIERVYRGRRRGGVHRRKGKSVIDWEMRRLEVG